MNIKMEKHSKTDLSQMFICPHLQEETSEYIGYNKSTVAQLVERQIVTQKARVQIPPSLDPKRLCFIKTNK